MNIGNLLKSISKSENRKAEGLRFVVTGTIATTIQYGFYLLFLSLPGFSAVISTMLSYGISFAVNYIASNLFTFRTRPSRKNAISFLCSHLINFVLQTTLVAFFSNIIRPEYALIPAMIICVPCNFFMVRYALKSHHFS